MLIDPTTLVTFTLALTVMFGLLSIAFVLTVIEVRRLSAQNHWTMGLISEYERYLEELSSTLHNKVQQDLIHLRHTALGNSANIAATLTPDKDKARKIIDDIYETLSCINRSMNLEFLRTQSLSRLIESELEIAKSNSAIIAYEIDCLREPELNFRTKLLLFRIAQEAISNVGKHAVASSIYFSLKRQDKKLVLLIEDDGPGIGEEKIYGAPTHGFSNMRNRAATLRAKLSISSERELGTTVTVELNHFQ